jgi:EAL domain-containing protein (putative c-di-GMP-specific phosphodiesterase class I)
MSLNLHLVHSLGRVLLQSSLHHWRQERRELSRLFTNIQASQLPSSRCAALSVLIYAASRPKAVYAEGFKSVVVVLPT